LGPAWGPGFATFQYPNTNRASTIWRHDVEQRRYRFRFLNGCQSRFLILGFNRIPGVEVWPIGNEGGFLASPVNMTALNGDQLLMGLAERAHVIVDFTHVPVAGQHGPGRALRQWCPRCGLPAG
jgi:FtsP/CotA-like multicopper oxidase with cupredoxin domain